VEVLAVMAAAGVAVADSAEADSEVSARVGSAGVTVAAAMAARVGSAEVTVAAATASWRKL